MTGCHLTSPRLFGYSWPTPSACRPASRQIGGRICKKLATRSCLEQPRTPRRRHRGTPHAAGNMLDRLPIALLTKVALNLEPLDLRRLGNSCRACGLVWQLADSAYRAKEEDFAKGSEEQVLKQKFIGFYERVGYGLGLHLADRLQVSKPGRQSFSKDSLDARPTVQLGRGQKAFRRCLFTAKYVTLVKFALTHSSKLRLISCRLCVGALAFAT